MGELEVVPVHEYHLCANQGNAAGSVRPGNPRSTAEVDVGAYHDQGFGPLITASAHTLWHGRPSKSRSWVG